MAITVRGQDDDKTLFILDDRKCELLSEILETYKQWTGLVIDVYGDTKLTTENQQTLVKVIDAYISSADLNKDKQRTVFTLEMRALLSLSISNNYDLICYGD